MKNYVVNLKVYIWDISALIFKKKIKLIIMNRKYTLERMFTSQLVESAKDELSFRTVVRDLRTKSPMLQIVLVNPNSWCCSGDCLDTKSNTDSVLKLDLHPVIKVLFSDCSSNTESQLRLVS
jgi:hypothetical protein